MTDRNIGEELLAQAAALLEPVVLAAGNPGHRQQLLDALGWDLAALTGWDQAVFGHWLDEVAAAVRLVRDEVAAGGPKTIGELADALPVAQGAVHAATHLPPFLSGGLPAGLDELPALMAKDLLDHLTVTALLSRAPVVHHLLVLLGLITPAADAEPSAPVPATGPPVRKPLRRARLELDRIPDLLTDPAGTLRALYFPNGWHSSDEADRAASVLFPRLANLLTALGMRAHYGLDTEQAPPLGAAARAIAGHMLTVEADLHLGGAAATVGFSLALSAEDRGGLGVVVIPRGEVAYTALAGGWAVTVDAAAAGPGIAFGARGVTVSAGAAAVRASVGAAKLPGPDGGSLLIGSVTGTRLQVGQLSVTLSADFGEGADDVGIEVALADAAFVLAAGDGDGFLQKVLPKELRIPFDLTLGWSRARGLYVKGSGNGTGGIGGTLPVALDLGPVKIPSVTVSATPRDGALVLELTASADVALGPVAASIERTGLLAELSFPPGGGNLGPMDLAVRYVPPAGIGLAITSDLVTGGGYLFADPAVPGSYGGAVQLQIGKVGVGAIGILNTRMPDGTPGFSLLVLFSVRFPPIQLGMGFALTGIGGLVGVHRTVDVAALQAGLPTGALDAVLFPRDLATNARQAVSDLARYFPPKAGQFVFGPTVELVWGTPTVVTITAGIFLELPIPFRIVLAGKLNATLPSPKAPVVVLKLDMLGVLDFTNKTLAIDAVLRDSRVAVFTVSGRAALRASWGDRPSFLLAAGGFNPRFTPPSSFPVLPRLSIALGSSDNPRLQLTAYLAITSNTVQVGAKLELYAYADLSPLGTFSVAAVVGFDALFTFSPFSFVVDVGVSVAIMWDGDPFLAASLSLTLSGPKPWHAVGEATFTFCGKHSVHFDVTIGDRQLPAAKERRDLGAEVRAALRWQAELPALAQPMVATLAPKVPDGAVVVHPFGTLSVRQRVAPLNTTMDKYGTAEIAGDRSVRISAVQLGGTLYESAALTTTYDSFALATFLEMTDEQKLSAPSYQRLPAGVEVPRPAPRTSAGIAFEAGYETVTIDPGPPRARFAAPAVTAEQHAADPDLLLVQAGGGAAALAAPAVRTGEDVHRGSVPAAVSALTAAAATGTPLRGPVRMTEPAYAVADPALSALPPAVPNGPSNASQSYPAAETARRRAGGAWRVLEQSELSGGQGA